MNRATNHLASLLLPAFALTWVLAHASPAAATPPDTFGFGSRSSSLGGAVTATVQDVSAAYYNPAGLARSGELQVQFGYFNQTPLLALNGERSNVERQGWMNFGLVAPATFGNFRVAFGLGLQLPDQRVARTRSAIVDRPRWELYDTRNHRLYLSTHLAIRPVPWLTIGGGLVFQSASTLTLDVRGNVPLVDPETNARLEHQFKGDLTSIRYPSVGIQVQPHERFAIGLVYRGAVKLSNTIIALADATVEGSIPLEFSLDSQSTSLYGPHQVSLGFDITPIDRLHVGLELTWYHWSAHPSLIAEQDIILTSPVITLDEISALPQIPMDMHDTFVPRIGVEYRALEGDYDLDLRLGYVYENSPYPEQRGVTNFVDNDKHTMSVGFGLGINSLRPTLPGSIRLNGHFSFAHLRSRRHRKSDLTDPVGDYESSGNLIAAGLDLTLAFE